MIRTSKQYVPTWYLLINILAELKRQRNQIEKEIVTDFQIASLNASMIVHLAAIIEGSINSLFTQKIDSNPDYKKAKLGHNLEVVRVFESVLNSLQKSTWKDLSENLATIIIGNRLNQIYKHDWDSIKFLFEFRNLLAHGGLIVRKTEMISQAKSIHELKEYDEEIIENLTKEKLFRFLGEKKLVEFDLDDHLSIIGWKMINSKTVDYFLEHARRFIISIYKFYMENHPRNNSIESDFAWIEKEL